MVVPGHELLQLARDSKEETKEMLTQESLGRGIVTVWYIMMSGQIMKVLRKDWPYRSFARLQIADQALPKISSKSQKLVSPDSCARGIEGYVRTTDES